MRQRSTLSTCCARAPSWQEAAPQAPVKREKLRPSPPLLALPPPPAATHAAAEMSMPPRSTCPMTGAAGVQGRTSASAFTAAPKPTASAVAAPGGFLLTDDSAVRAVSAAGIVSTIAGTGVLGAAGDGGAATAAQLNLPRAALEDVDGSFYILDNGNHKVRFVSAAQTITTVVGTGAAGFADATGTSALLNFPAGGALDTCARALFIASDRPHARFFSVPPCR